MAQQNYTFYKYTADNGDIYKIRASTKVFGAQPTTPSTTGFAGKPSVNVGRGNRGYGVRPRAIRLKRQAGSAPNIKVYYDQLPVFLAADAATLLSQTSIDLDGVAWTPDSLIPESIR